MQQLRQAQPQRQSRRAAEGGQGGGLGQEQGA